MLHADAHSYLFLHASAHVASGLVGKQWTLRAASQMTKPLAELFSGLVAWKLQPLAHRPPLYTPEPDFK